MKTRYISLLAFILTFFSISLYSHNDHVPGQLIVQLNSRNTDIEKVLDINSKHKLSVVRCLSKRLNIFLLEHSSLMEDDRMVLKDIKSSKGVANAQFNHYISMRDTEPNDTRFDDQWNLKNTGQSGGTVDADIDATEAWDITTGGYSANGDTIVIAIVDDGFDIDHQDLSFRKNYNEIPQNGIDDDNNGYVDDYLGWNSYSHSGNIYSEDHGTHVAGIAGARSNNSVGVAGVNWHAQLLAAQGSSTVEAPVVEAYGYIYEIRASYDESGGQQGAFVVATNASFGVNYGQPEDYPVWGAMYDSLGQLGILSCGATANGNINIDDVGDIPTAFPSDYMLSVTNTTKNDEKNIGAAYGLNTIDIGAPGTTVLSTRQNNNYGMKTGTSMASPHAAGAIGLILSAGSESFIDAYNDNPSEVILLIKEYIIAGVDTLPDLLGKTVSGGRLNVYKAINYLIAPAFVLSPDNLEDTVEQNKTHTLKAGLENVGPAGMTYSVTIAGNPSWININPSGSISAYQSDSLELEVNTNGLTPGNYEAVMELLNLKGEFYTVEVLIHVVPPSLINEDKHFDVIRCYPNPFSESIRFEFYKEKPGRMNIAVYDLNGKLIKTLSGEHHYAGIQKMLWHGRDESGNEVENGIYMLRINDGGKSSLVKLLKQR